MRLVAGAAEALRRLNARHPWSHNDHFHSWITAHLPARRTAALDLGCGQGELAAVLATRFTQVLAVDADPGMQAATAARCAGLPNVTVGGTPLARLNGPFDLITMVAVLHHLDVEETLAQVPRLLAPGGRLLVVGLAVPHTVLDHLWDTASAITNPLIGWVKHPWPSPDPHQVTDPPYPVREPTLTFDEIAAVTRRVLPGARMRHHLGFRHTITWTAAADAGPG